MTRRTTHLLLLTAAVLIAAAFGYHYLRDRTFTYRLSEAEIQRRLDAAPPFARTYSGIVEVTLDNTRVSLVEGSERVRAGSDVAVRMGLGQRGISISGSVEASGGVRFDPETGGFFITDPVVEHVALPGLPEANAPRVRDAIARALRVYYDRHPIHTLGEDDVRQATARLLVRDVRVVDRHLVVTLGVRRTRP